MATTFPSQTTANTPTQSPTPFVKPTDTTTGVPVSTRDQKEVANERISRQLSERAEKIHAGLKSPEVKEFLSHIKEHDPEMFVKVANAFWNKDYRKAVGWNSKDPAKAEFDHMISLAEKSKAIQPFLTIDGIEALQLKHDAAIRSQQSKIRNENDKSNHIEHKAQLLATYGRDALPGIEENLKSYFSTPEQKQIAARAKEIIEENQAAKDSKYGRTPRGPQSIYIDSTGKDDAYFKKHPEYAPGASQPTPTIHHSISSEYSSPGTTSVSSGLTSGPRSRGINTSVDLGNHSEPTSTYIDSTVTEKRSRLQPRALGAEDYKKMDFDAKSDPYIPSPTMPGAVESLPYQIKKDGIAEADLAAVNERVNSNGLVTETRKAYLQRDAYLRDGTPQTMGIYTEADRYRDVNSLNDQLDKDFKGGKLNLPYHASFDAFGNVKFEVRMQYASINPDTKQVENYSRYSPEQTKAYEATLKGVKEIRELSSVLDRLSSRYQAATSIELSASTDPKPFFDKVNEHQLRQLGAREAFFLDQDSKSGRPTDETLLHALQDKGELSKAVGTPNSTTTKSFSAKEIAEDIWYVGQLEKSAKHNGADLTSIKKEIQEKISALPYNEKLSLQNALNVYEKHFEKNSEKNGLATVLEFKKPLDDFKACDKIFKEFKELRSEKDHTTPEFRLKKIEFENQLRKFQAKEVNSSEWQETARRSAEQFKTKDMLAAFNKVHEQARNGATITIEKPIPIAEIGKGLMKDFEAVKDGNFDKLKEKIASLTPEQREKLNELVENKWPKHVKVTDPSTGKISIDEAKLGRYEKFLEFYRGIK